MSVPLVVQDVRDAGGTAPTYVDAITGTLSADSEYRIFDAPVGDDLVVHVWQTGVPGAHTVVTPSEMLAPDLLLGEPVFVISATTCAVTPLSVAYKGANNRCEIRVGGIDNGGTNQVWVAVLRVPR